jgi:hypothetical protein
MEEAKAQMALGQRIDRFSENHIVSILLDSEMFFPTWVYMKFM